MKMSLFSALSMAALFSASAFAEEETHPDRSPTPPTPETKLVTTPYAEVDVHNIFVDTTYNGGPYTILDWMALGAKATYGSYLSAQVEAYLQPGKMAGLDQLWAGFKSTPGFGMRFGRIESWDGRYDGLRASYDMAFEGGKFGLNAFFGNAAVGEADLVGKPATDNRLFGGEVTAGFSGVDLGFYIMNEAKRTTAEVKDAAGNVTAAATAFGWTYLKGSVGYSGMPGLGATAYVKMWQTTKPKTVKANENGKLSLGDEIAGTKEDTKTEFSVELKGTTELMGSPELFAKDDKAFVMLHGHFMSDKEKIIEKTKSQNTIEFGLGYTLSKFTSTLILENVSADDKIFTNAKGDKPEKSKNTLYLETCFSL